MVKTTLKNGTSRFTILYDDETGWCVKTRVTTAPQWL
jgi:hypothetical protein